MTTSTAFIPFFQLPTLDFSKLQSFDLGAAALAAREQAQAWRALATQGLERAAALSQEQVEQFKQVRSPEQLVATLTAAHKTTVEASVAQAQAVLTLGSQQFGTLLSQAKLHSPLPHVTDGALEQVQRVSSAVEGFVAKGLSKAAELTQHTRAQATAKTSSGAAAKPSRKKTA